MAVPTQGEGRQILGLLDELLALLIQLHHQLLGLGPAVDEADHGLHEASKERTSLIGLTAEFVATEFIHQVIPGIFQITGNRGDNFQHLIDICAYRCFPRCKIEQSFLELCRLLPGLGGQAAMLAATAHGTLVAVAQLEVDAVEIFPTQGLWVRRKVGGRG